MHTRVIEQSQWNSYLSRMSNALVNHLATVQVLTPELGEQVVADHLPLLGISPELKGSEALAVDIQLGKLGSAQGFLHQIPLVKRVIVQEDDSGQPATIDIEGEDPVTHGKIQTLVTVH